MRNQAMPRVHLSHLFLATVLTIAAALPCHAQALRLNTVFQNHAVLQCDAPIPVWGKAEPGQTITVEMAGATASAGVDGQGNWSVRMPALAAGGPYAMNVRSSSGARQFLSDILIGDVFLCSGQSNMELPVSRTLNAPSEIGAASNDRIRMLKIGLESSPAPLDTLPAPVAWELAAPVTVPDWSAACYYFARDLQRNVDVPIGLINSSWGGSDIRAWMSDDALAEVGGYEDELALLHRYSENQDAAQQAFGETWQAWWRATTGDAAGAEPWQPGAGANWREAPAGLGDWKLWDEPDLRAHLGMLWHRTTVDLTAAQAQQDAVLSLGAIDEVDQSWVNGRAVGNTFGWGTDRTYHIPAGFLHEGENTIVVNVLNTWGMGGMTGDPARRALMLGDSAAPERIPLETWRYLRVPTEVGTPPRTPWEAVAGLSTIYNAMVAPLHGYGLKGILWYQGAANTGDGQDAYLALLQALMHQWRDQFGENIPILIVQLANYGQPPTMPVESGWAEVREAQRLAVRGDAHAALAVTIDLGDAYDIHPANKQQVGERLARAARHLIYGEHITPSGPIPVSATLRGDTAIVTFDDVEGTLVAYGNTDPIGFEVCGAGEGTCTYTRARIDGVSVLLPAPANARRVRYCWADSPICTLYDEAHLPAGPFELTISN